MEEVKIYRSVAKLKSIDLFYLDTKTKGPAVLCLHGRWGRAETWMDFIKHYGSQYRIIAPDQRGHGLSGKPIAKYSAQEMAQDMIELLNYLGLESVILVGHSMGGRIAGYLAALHFRHVMALALLDKSASGPYKARELTVEQISAIDPFTKEWPLPFTSRIEGEEYIKKVTESELSCQYFMSSLIETVDGYRMMYSNQAIAANIAYEENWFDLLPDIKCPVLLLRSSGSGAVSDEDFVKMQSLMKNCLAREVSHPDHNVHLADKKAFYAYFDEFLDFAGGRK